MQPSSRQRNILDKWQHTEDNILVGAVAGSGKTTLLMMLLELCEYRTLFIAFNKSIQTEIQNKIEEKGLKQGKAITMHSMGLSAIKNHIKFSINNRKSWDLVRKVQNEMRLYRVLDKKDVLKASYTLIDMNEVSRMFLTDNFEDIKNYMHGMDKVVFNNPMMVDIWNKFVVFREESYMGNKIDIDFTDMIYLPIKWDLEIPVHPYYLFMDEVQDFNLAQHKLIDKLISQGTIKKWVAVGDRNQAIYGFAGASSNAFDLFFDKPGNVVEMPLDICYRCSSDIIQEANRVYDVMEAANTEKGIVDIEYEIENIKPNSMIICRNTTPLLYVYFKLLSLGKPCFINGSEIMNYLLKFLKPYYKSSIRSALVDMEYKYEELLQDHSEEGSFQAYIFKENYNNFKIVSESLSESAESVETLTKKLENLFLNIEDAIMLCTIHKSKGLEADVVYILNEELIPSKFAKSPEQLRQESNLKYVARTRAKKELYYLNIKTNEDV